MKKQFSYCFFLLLLLMLQISVRAQHADSAAGKIEIIQDPRVETLMDKHTQINQSIKTIDGYRIQLFSDSGNNSKTKAHAVQDEFLVKYPEIRVYLTFKSPNYKVRIGDFRTKLDAQRFLIEITPDYSNAFIISDQINLPKTN